jgi:hypothetical protein
MNDVAKSPEGLFLVTRISLFAQDLREKRDGLDGSSSRVALVALTLHALEQIAEQFDRLFRRVGSMDEMRRQILE